MAKKTAKKAAKASGKKRVKKGVNQVKAGKVLRSTIGGKVKVLPGQIGSLSLVPGHRHRDETAGVGGGKGKRKGDTGGTPVPLAVPLSASLAVSAGKLPEPMIQLVKLEAIDLGDALVGGRGGDEKSLHLDELAESIRVQGVIEPVLLISRAAKGKAGDRTHYVCPDGSRRVRAAKMAGLDEIPAAVYPSSCLDRAEEIRATAVVQKVDHTPVDVAVMVAGLLEQERERAKAETIDDSHIQRVAARLGKTARWVADYRYLGRLSKNVLDLVRSGRLPLTHARAISVVGDAETQEGLARHAARQPDGSGGQNLAQLLRWVRDKRLSLKVVPWNQGVGFAGKPACDGCPHNSASDVDLWAVGQSPAEIDRERRSVGDNGPYCSNRKCFDHKREAADRAKDKAQDAAKKLIKAGKLDAASPAAVVEAKLVPAGMRPDVIARAVKVEMDRGGEATAKKQGDSGTAKQHEKKGPGKIELSVKEKARQRWEAAKEEFAEKIREMLRDALKARPGGVSLMVTTFGDPSPLAAKITPSYSGEDAEKKIGVILKSPGTIELAKPFELLVERDHPSAAASPLLLALHDAERVAIAGNEHGYSLLGSYLDDVLRGLCDAVVVFLLDRLGVKDVPTRPELATFEREAGVGGGGGDSPAAKKGDA